MLGVAPHRSNSFLSLHGIFPHSFPSLFVGFRTLFTAFWGSVLTLAIFSACLGSVLSPLSLGLFDPTDSVDAGSHSSPVSPPPSFLGLRMSTVLTGNSSSLEPYSRKRTRCSSRTPALFSSVFLGSLIRWMPGVAARCSYHFTNC